MADMKINNICIQLVIPYEINSFNGYDLHHYTTTIMLLA